MQTKGGKNASGVYQRIINQIPPHTTYIEPFIRSGAIMRLKKPADVSIGIDIDMDVIKMWEDLGYGGIVMHGDAISFLRSYSWQGGEFVYADPPYLKKDIDGRPVRASQGDIYKHEFGTVEQHTELLTVLLSLPCMVAISGYKSKLYDQMLKSWRAISYQTRTRGGSQVTEYLWMNYSEPWELHDYSYLGNDYREREKLAKRKRRWGKRLANMPAMERYAMLDALQQFRKASP